MAYNSSEKTTTFRQPSTASLFIDSQDRPNASTTYPWDFQITRNNSILNGFFTRIGTTEVVLEWFLGNAQAIGDIDVEIDASGTETISFGASTDYFLTYEGALNAFVASCNDAFGFPVHVPGSAPPANGFFVETGFFPTASPSGVAVALNVANASVDFELNGPGCPKMGFAQGLMIPLQPIFKPDLRLVRYLDFVSTPLTALQELKDSTTQVINKDVLVRWYFDWDDQPILDGYGFPILMGYTPFTLRRSFSPPKQIRWDPTQPLGNLSFQVFTDTNKLLTELEENDIPEDGKSNWLMTLQISEV